jgi:predicted TIM-barrel fold metal-dependent hydrolase
MARIPKIDLESHFFTREYVNLLLKRKKPPRMEKAESVMHAWLEPSREDIRLQHGFRLLETLLDLGPDRIKAMDEVGIAVQCLSLSSPGIEQFEPDVQIKHAREANDVLAEFIRAYPRRFIALASLPVSAPEAAADELERCVNELGFKGLNIHSHIGNTYLDNRVYFPILERAARLNVPLNLHPTLPHGNMLEAYMGLGWALPGPGLGFGHETAVHAMRIVLSGVFDRLPDLRLILGHFGEGLMHWLYRVDFDFNKPWMDKTTRPAIAQKPSDYLRKNVWYTTSGNWLDSALLSTIHEVGSDRIMFASDYPWELIEDGANFIENAPVDEAVKIAVCHQNAERFFNVRIGPNGLE